MVAAHVLCHTGYGVTLGKRQSIDNQMEVIIEDAAGVDTEADVVNLPIARVNGTAPVVSPPRV